MVKTFNAGDKVFAKVRGYPPWPARVESLADATPTKNKYNVFFYGTSETAVCKVEDLYAYSENKDRYGRPLKRKGFNEALAQIEGTAPLPPTPKALETRSPTEDPDSDTEGDLVIDESPRPPVAKPAKADASEEKKKQPMKRKRESDVVEADAEAKRTKRTSLVSSRKGSIPALAPPEVSPSAPPTNTPTATPAATPNATPTSPPKGEPLVSRSGRKIKPKKFADEETMANTPEDTPAALPDGKAPADTPLGKRRKSVKANANSTTRESEDSQSTTRARENSDDEEEDFSDKDDADRLLKDFSPAVNSKEIASYKSPVVVTATAPTGEIVKITLNEDRPEKFISEKARQRWERATAVNAARLKNQIESGEFLPEDLQEQIELRRFQKVEEEQLNHWNRVLDSKKGKLRWLRLEARMVELDAFIKGHLGLTRADPDRTLELLDEMSMLQLEPLMLKKHPQVVETIKRLRRYVGNPAGWHFSEEETLKFSAKAVQIRNKAEHVYNKFKAMFTIPEGRTFWQVFADKVTMFHKLTQNLPRDKVYSLVVDPSPKEKPASGGTNESADEGEEQEGDVGSHANAGAQG